jgi:hypothetical protein
MKALVVFYSMYGHIYKMAETIAEGDEKWPVLRCSSEGSLRR